MNDEKVITGLLKEDLQELHRLLDDLNLYQKRQASLRWNFWRGVFYGFGFFIGSVILTTLLIYILSQIGGSESVFGNILRKFIDLVEKNRH